MKWQMRVAGGLWWCPLLVPTHGLSKADGPPDTVTIEGHVLMVARKPNA
jgi:hypothetical protein